MKRSLSLAVTAVFVVAACGGSSYGRDDAIEAMVDDAGFPPAFAECVADGAEEHDIPWDATDESLNDEGGEYFEVMQEILIDCDAALGDAALGDDDGADDADGRADDSGDDHDEPDDGESDQDDND